MSKAHNRNMERKRRRGNMTPQKANNYTIEGLVESEGDESAISDLRRMMIRVFNRLKVDI
jgi:predicted Fe-Mo cluster-binding NifX family protein